MKKILAIVLSVLISGSALAQADGSTTVPSVQGPLPAGVSITILDPNIGMIAEVAEELYLTPYELSGVIPHNGSTTALSLSIVSRVDTEITIRVNHPDVLISGNSNVRMRAGNRTNASFTVLSPHSGVIEFVNSLGEVIARVPYAVTKQSSFRQNVSANVNFEGNLGASYGISFENGTRFGVNMGYSPQTGNVTGGVAGSYSW